jgi:hypothetical protein
MKMSAAMEGLYNIARGNDDMRDIVVDWILDLQNIDTCLSYFINYERSINLMINEAKLENAKLKLHVDDLAKINEELTKKLENCMSSWESQTSK